MHTYICVEDYPKLRMVHYVRFAAAVHMCVISSVLYMLYKLGYFCPITCIADLF